MWGWFFHGAPSAFQDAWHAGTDKNYPEEKFRKQSKWKLEFLCVWKICITKKPTSPIPTSLGIKTTYLLLITLFIIPFRSKTEIHSQDTSWRHSGISPWKYHLGKQSLLKFAHYYLQSSAVWEKTGARRQPVSLFLHPQSQQMDGW